MGSGCILSQSACPSPCRVKGMAEAPIQIKKAKGKLRFQRQICCHLTCYQGYHTFTLAGLTEN